MDSHTQDLNRPIAEISHAPGKFDAFMERHQRSMLLLAIGLVLAAVVYIILHGIKQGAEHDAGAALVSSTDLASYQATAKQHPGTSAGGSAMVVAAQLQWDDGQQDASIATLQAFLKQYPEHPGRPAATASLASRLARLGRSDEAASHFQALVDDPASEYLAPLALTSLGDIHWKAGKIDQAELSYKRVVNEYPDSPFSFSAKRRLSLLHAELPVAIDARPVTAPEPGSFDQKTMEELLKSGVLPQGFPAGLNTPAPGSAPAPAQVTPPAAPAPAPAAPSAPEPAQGK
jgi:tetratricopeptide (TPR) repeat protein